MAAGVPLHRQLFLVLHDEIMRGALNPGDALPTEQSLCDQFGVSRITVRRALADLADDGFIERKHGIGSFVLDRPVDAHREASNTYQEELLQVEFTTEVEVLEFGVRPVPRGIAGQLGSPERALHALRLRRARRTGEPLMTTEVWLPIELDGIVTEAALRHRPLYELLDEAGVTPERLDHELTAEIAGPRNARLLDIAIGSPLMRVNRVTVVGGAPHHFMSIVLSPRRSRVVLSQSVDLPAGTALAITHDVRRPNA